MTTFAPDKPRRNVMITDLDQSDEEQQQQTKEPSTPQRLHHSSHGQTKKRNPEKNLRTISGNFKRRSRSAECSLQQEGHEDTTTKTKRNNYFNELLQSKDKQMEQLLQRLATLHKYNEQFAEENRALRVEVGELDERVAGLKQQVRDCPNCRRLHAQLQQTTEVNRALDSDIGMMKTLVYRLNVQIEYYQDRLRGVATNNNNNSNNKDRPHSSEALLMGDRVRDRDRDGAAPWKGSVHTRTLGPLLKSYDEMIKDKQELIQQYKHEFETFTGELKTVLEENTRLLEQNETLKRDSGTWREERTRLQAQVDVCRTKAEAQTRKSDLAKEKLVEVMHCYEQKMQTLVLDMEHLQSAYSRCKAELASLKSLTAQPQESIVQALQECKELLEQLKTQHGREKAALEQTIVELRRQQAANDQRCEQLRTENQELQRRCSANDEGSEELRRRVGALQRSTEKVKRSRDRLKARLRIALQWAQKLEEGQANMQNTWDALKRLETIVKHKESQVRGLHARHMEEVDKMQKKLEQKEETIRRILKGKLASTAHDC